MNIDSNHAPSLKKVFISNNSTLSCRAPHIYVSESLATSSTIPSLPSLVKGTRDKKHYIRNKNVWNAVALQQHATVSGEFNLNYINNNISSSSSSSNIINNRITSIIPVEQRLDQFNQVQHNSSNVSNNTVSDSIRSSITQRLHNRKLTLAQKLGLVPRPPSPPTAREWAATEQQALEREDNEISTRCSICYQPFYSTFNQGQVILSCSHVFHERCFAQFEKFVRRQQHSSNHLFTFIEESEQESEHSQEQHHRQQNESNRHNRNRRRIHTVVTQVPINIRLACPVCRSLNYHKRTFYAGKVAAQHAAIIRIQALIRGFCARRRYLKYKLEQNSLFRNEYVQSHLARLSEAWDKYLTRREVQRDAEMAELDIRRDIALGAYLLEED